MNLTDEQKLNMFAKEAFTEAEKYCDEIKALIEQEKKEKVEKGKSEILSHVFEYMQTEIHRIRKEKSILISKKNTELRQEYLRQTDAIFTKVLSEVRERLTDFTLTEEYVKYLKEMCLKIVSLCSDTMDIHCSIKDMKYIEDIKTYLKQNKINLSSINFIQDKSIKLGGCKFYERRKNIQINETLEEKLLRSEENLNEMIGKFFSDIT